MRELYEGTDASLKNIILRFAHEVIPCMRDHSADERIPDPIEPDLQYSVRLIEKNMARLADLSRWDGKRAEAEAVAAYEKELKEVKDSIRDSEERIKRFEKARDDIKAWVIPTPRHKDLKDYIIRSIKDAIRHEKNKINCAKEFFPRVMVGAAYKQIEINRALFEIEACRGRIEDDEQRAAEQEEYMKQLRASIKSLS